MKGNVEYVRYEIIFEKKNRVKLLLTYDKHCSIWFYLLARIHVHWIDIVY